MIAPKRISPRLRPTFYGCALLTVAAVIGVCLWAAGPVPWNDEGGYIRMTEYFTRTGTVDFMRWCQPTFLGVLPVSAPVAAIAGAHPSMFGLVGLAYFLLFLGGLYVFLVPYTGPGLAFTVGSFVFAVGELAVLMSCFMTDVPYLAYIVWLLILQRALESRGTLYPARRAAALWLTWSAAFLLALLVRPFALVFIAVFAVESVRARGSRRHEARRFLAVAVIVATVAFLLLHALAVNRFTIMEQTVYDEVVRQGNLARLDLRQLGLAILYVSVVLAPIFVLWVPSHRARISTVELAVVAIICGVAFRLWHNGRIQPIVTVAGFPGASRWVVVLQVVAAPVGAVLLFRICRWGISATESMVAPCLAVLLVSQLAILPIMQHPLPRHVLPALIAAVMLASMSGLARQRLWRSLSMAVIVVMAAGALVQAYSVRRENAVEWAACETLVRKGIPLADIDGGWTWFCYNDLHPGALAPADYRTEFYALKRDARFEVADAAAPREAGARLLWEAAVSPLRQRVAVLDRRPTSRPAGTTTAPSLAADPG